jgi:hypothetical protein
MKSENQRTLTNPPIRREIRPDFPRTIPLNDSREILQVVEEELGKLGLSPEDVGHITLAYPHKLPELFSKNNATGSVGVFLDTVKKNPRLAAIPWLRADGLVETKSLERKRNKTSAHALLVHQIYDIHKPSQTTPLPFLEQGAKEELFIIIDHNVKTGTTVAEMMSYIEHNGGRVLAVAAGYFPGEGVHITQRDEINYSSSLSPRFNDAARNTAKLPLLGFYLSKNAGEEGLNLTPEQCLDLLEKGLHKNGNSVYAMTNAECGRLLNDMRVKALRFSSFMKKLGIEITSRNKSPALQTPPPTA